jgi:NAD(P)-binding Rossmann-like domain
VTLTRRDFVSLLLGAPAAAAWACARPVGARPPPGDLLDTGAAAGHRWVREAQALAAPVITAPVRRHRVVIVGGGAAGLGAAWALRHLGISDVVVLELQGELGGTARGGASAVTSYPWGAHYIVAPTVEQHELTALLSEMGAIEGYTSRGAPIVDEALRCREPEERIFYRGRWYEGLYLRAGASAEDLRQLAAFQAEVDRWASWRDGAGVRAFSIPQSRCSTAPEVTALDQQTFGAWLDRRGLTSPRLRWLCDYACRDDYGLTAATTSAWAGLFYFAARQTAAGVEPQPVVTWPDGNHALIRHLGAAASARLDAVVTSVEPSPDPALPGVQVLAHTAEGPARFVAERVIVAVPRFVARRIVAPLRTAGPSDLPGAASPADYGAWAVANVHLRQRPAESAGAPRAWDNVLYTSKSLGYVSATHQQGRETGATVLTWYYPFVDEDAAAARRKIVGAGQPEWAELVLADLEPAHPDVRRHVTRLDVAFWGHGMIRPRVGAIWHPQRQQAMQPVGGIHFAHTDLSGVALFEEAFDHGNRAAREVATALAGRTVALRPTVGSTRRRRRRRPRRRRRRRGCSPPASISASSAAARRCRWCCWRSAAGSAGALIRRPARSGRGSSRSCSATSRTCGRRRSSSISIPPSGAGARGCMAARRWRRGWLASCSIASAGWSCSGARSPTSRRSTSSASNTAG